MQKECVLAHASLVIIAGRHSRPKTRFWLCGRDCLNCNLLYTNIRCICWHKPQSMIGWVQWWKSNLNKRRRIFMSRVVRSEDNANWIVAEDAVYTDWCFTEHQFTMRLSVCPYISASIMCRNHLFHAESWNGVLIYPKYIVMLICLPYKCLTYFNRFRIHEIRSMAVWPCFLMH